MRKELVQKYKAEFNHWLNGGDLLVRMYKEAKWRPVYTDCTWSCMEAQYIINDEYVHLRKAKADGKQIEYNPLLLSHNRWDSIDFKKVPSSPPKHYRVKPPQRFKEGDWVVNVNYNGNHSNPFKAEADWVECRPGGNTARTGSDEDFVLWKPLPGAWVVTWSCSGGIYYRITPYYKENMLTNIAPLEFVDELGRLNREQIKNKD